jgi:anti-sigma B factor antagonist
VLHGELDIATAPELVEMLHRFRRQGHAVALDLAEVTFMDVAGMRVLLEAAQRARSRQARMIIFNPRRCASRVFGLTAVDQQLQIVFDDPEHS